MMPKGQKQNKHGSIVNLSANVSKTCTELTREGSCEEVILLKLRKKLYFKGQIYFEQVMPQKVRATLKYLHRVNPLYHNGFIKDCNLNEDLLSSGSNLPKNSIDFDLQSDNELESASNPLSAPGHAANKSLAIY